MVGKPIIPASMRGSYEAFQFAPATRAGDLLILSGQIGVGPDGKLHANSADYGIADAGCADRCA
jgi:enamine deaminase RidA (YjgF/YER057c/UK114 family)